MFSPAKILKQGCASEWPSSAFAAEQMIAHFAKQPWALVCLCCGLAITCKSWGHCECYLPIIPPPHVQLYSYLSSSLLVHTVTSLRSPMGTNKSGLHVTWTHLSTHTVENKTHLLTFNNVSTAHVNIFLLSVILVCLWISYILLGKLFPRGLNYCRYSCFFI